MPGSNWQPGAGTEEKAAGAAGCADRAGGPILPTGQQPHRKIRVVMSGRFPDSGLARSLLSKASSALAGPCFRLPRSIISRIDYGMESQGTLDFRARSIWGKLALHGGYK